MTAITRDESTSSFPAGVKVQRGSYTSDEFLVSALQDQDVFTAILVPMAPKDLQSGLIKAAAAAGVPWILPNE